ncbi:MAG TPA: hypothetical protein VNH22_02210 [Blastocatellia bacterium]|jgi:hypothetical protein|nr:hypothetical protein [Blastocatellia bacterium]
MLKRRGSPYLLLLLLLALPSIFVSTSARAQDGATAEPASKPEGEASVRNGGLEMSVKAGFGRIEVVGNTGTWVPFRITVANQGEPISGRLVVRGESESDPAPQYRQFVKDVQLPSGSRQYHEISAYLNSGEDVVVRLMAGDRVVAEVSLTAQRISSNSDTMEIAVVDSDATTLNSISSTEVKRNASREPFSPVTPGNGATVAQATLQQGPGSAGQPGGPPPPPRGPRGFGAFPQQQLTAHPTVISADDIPRDFVSYDALDVLVLGDAPLSQLTEEQAHALKIWVASGGLLIVTGGADFAGLRAVGLDALLPVDVHGAGVSSSIAAMTGLYGNFESAEPTLAMSATLRDGARALVGDGASPVIAEKHFGTGLVRFVAFNPKLNPYRGWGAAKDVWADLLLPSVEARMKPVNWITVGRRGNNSSSNFGIQNYLYQLADIKPPSSKYFLIFLIAYVLIVGPINYFVLRWKRKVDLAWLTIPAVVLIFTVVSITVAQVSRGGSNVAADVSLVEFHQPEGLARALGSLLIMPSSKQTAELVFDGGDTYVTDVRDQNGPSTSMSDELQVEREKDRLRLSVPLNTWTAAVFQTRSVSEGRAPLISATPAKGPQGSPSVTIRNLGKLPITRAVYLSPEGISETFDLGAEDQAQVALSAPQSITFNTWYLAQLPGEGAEWQIFTELAFVLDREIGGDRVFWRGFFDKETMEKSLKLLERPMLLGFVEESPTRMTFEGGLKRNSKAFYVVHL